MSKVQLSLAVAGWLIMGLLGSMAHAEAPLATAPSTGQVTDRSRVCMIDDNLQQQPGIPVAHAGKTYYLCCQGCVQRFSADPGRWSRAVDPVSGERVDKADAPIYAYNGRAYFFSNEDHLRAFAQQPATYLAAPADVAEHP